MSGSRHIDMKNDTFAAMRVPCRLPRMNNSAEPRATARILDFADYRARRAARQLTPSSAKRRFLWGWPAMGQVMVVSFPSPGPEAAQIRSRFR